MTKPKPTRTKTVANKPSRSPEVRHQALSELPQSAFAESALGRPPEIRVPTAQVRDLGALHPSESGRSALARAELHDEDRAYDSDELDATDLDSGEAQRVINEEEVRAATALLEELALDGNAANTMLARTAIMTFNRARHLSDLVDGLLGLGKVREAEMVDRVAQRCYGRFLSSIDVLRRDVGHVRVHVQNVHVGDTNVAVSERGRSR